MSNLGCDSPRRSFFGGAGVVARYYVDRVVITIAIVGGFLYSDTRLGTVNVILYHSVDAKARV